MLNRNANFPTLSKETVLDYFQLLRNYKNDIDKLLHDIQVYQSQKLQEEKSLNVDLLPQAAKTRQLKEAVQARIDEQTLPAQIATSQSRRLELEKEYHQQKITVQALNDKLREASATIKFIEACMDYKKKSDDQQNLEDEIEKSETIIKQLRNKKLELTNVIRHIDTDIAQCANTIETSQRNVSQTITTSIGGSGYTSSITNNANGYDSSNGYTTSQHANARDALQRRKSRLERELNDTNHSLTQEERKLHQQKLLSSTNRNALYAASYDIQNGAQQTSSGLQLHLNNRVAEKKRLENELYKVDQLKNLNSQITLLSMEEAHYQERLERAKNYSEFKGYQMDSLRSFLSVYESTLKQEEAKVEDKRQLIQNQERLIKESIHRKDIMINEEKNLRDDKFLNAYWQAPENLLQNIVDDLKKQLSSLENEPDLTFQTRKSIYLILSHVKTIVEFQIEHHSEYSQLHDYKQKDAQEKIVQITGMLWQEFEGLAVQDKALCDAIKNILKKYPIASEWSRAAFNDFPIKLADQQFEIHEKCLYEEVKSHFIKIMDTYEKTNNENDKNFSDIGRKLLQLVDTECKKSADPDRFYNASEFLGKAVRCATMPYDKNHQKAFLEQLKKTQDGHPSVAKRIAGVGMMFLGALGMAASCVIGAFIELPLAYALTVVGLSMSTVLFGVGHTLYQSGKPDGTYAVIQKYAEALKHTTLFKTPRQEDRAEAQPDLALAPSAPCI